MKSHNSQPLNDNFLACEHDCLLIYRYVRQILFRMFNFLSGLEEQNGDFPFNGKCRSSMVFHRN